MAFKSARPAQTRAAGGFWRAADGPRRDFRVEGAALVRRRAVHREAQRPAQRAQELGGRQPQPVRVVLRLLPAPPLAALRRTTSGAPAVRARARASTLMPPALAIPVFVPIAQGGRVALSCAPTRALGSTWRPFHTVCYGTKSPVCVLGFLLEAWRARGDGRVPTRVTREGSVVFRSLILRGPLEISKLTTNIRMVLLMFLLFFKIKKR